MREAVEGRGNILQNKQLLERMKLRCDVTVYQPFCQGFENMLVSSSVRWYFELDLGHIILTSSRCPCDACLARYMKLNKFLAYRIPCKSSIAIDDPRQLKVQHK